MYLSIIIPFFNEEKNLPILVEKLNHVLNSLNKSYQVIFINDGSTDNSLNVLEPLIDSKDNFELIDLKRNLGQTAAWKAGINKAQGEIIIIMDSDLENDPTDIPLLLDKIEQSYDIVSGWRKNRWQNKPLTRRLPSRIANWLISKVSGVKIHDLGCSLKAYRRELIKDIKLYGDMHRFLAVLAAWQGGKITEVEVKFSSRKYGQSKYGISRAPKVVLDLMLLRFLSGLSTPIYFFGKLGIFSIILSFITFAISIYYKFWGGKTFIETPLPVLAAIFFIVGAMLILIGILLEIVVRIYHYSQEKK